MRGDPNGFQVHRLNHSATTTLRVHAPSKEQKRSSQRDFFKPTQREGGVVSVTVAADWRSGP